MQNATIGRSIVPLVVLLLIGVLGVQDVAAQVQPEPEIRTVVEETDLGFGGKLITITEYTLNSDGTLSKSQARFDFLLRMTFPGQNVETSEEVVFEMKGLNGDSTDTVFSYYLEAANGTKLIEENNVQDNSIVERFTHSNTGEFQFHVRGENDTFSGTESYRDKILVYNVGSAPATAAPVAFDGTMTTTGGQRVCENLRQSSFVEDSDTPLSGINFHLVSKPQSGSTTNGSGEVFDDESDNTFDGEICYTPPANVVGSVSITWKASDNSEFSNVATLTVVVEDEAAQDPLECAGFASFSMEEGTTQHTEESCNATGLSVNNFKVNGSTKPSWIIVDVDNDDVEITFSPPVGADGQYRVTGDIVSTQRSGTESFDFTVTVTEEDSADPLECAGFVSFTMREGDTEHVEASCNATGLSINNLRVNGGSRPSWITRTVDNDDVEFVFSPPTGSAGAYRVRGDITSTGRSGTESFDFTVTVTTDGGSGGGDQDPVLADSSLNDLRDLQICHGESVNLWLQALDLDGGSIQSVRFRNTSGREGHPSWLSLGQLSSTGKFLLFSNEAVPSHVDEISIMLVITDDEGNETLIIEESIPVSDCAGEGGVCALPTNRYPNVDATIGPDNAVFTWNEVQGASQYHVQVFDFNDNVVGDATVTSASWNGFNPDHSGEYSWRVRAQVDGQWCAWTGETSFHAPSATSTEEDELPSEMTLRENYPNPFNPSTTVTFQLPKTMHVKMSVYDQLGREVVILLDQTMSAGQHEKNINASAGWASGVYLLRLESDQKILTQTMVLQK